jgi:hypothetical protein
MDIMSNPTEWEVWKKKYKCSCPLLDRSNPKWQENRQELYEALFPVNKGLAQDVWWWTDGIYLKQKYLRFLTLPIEEIPKFLNSEDESIQILVEWRLKHGQDL